MQIQFYLFLCSLAAFTNPTNKGCGLSGLEVNSGWNWLAIKKGWFGISTISTSLPSGEVPEQISPASSSPVSYTHLDVYKRQRLFPQILLFLLYLEHFCLLLLLVLHILIQKRYLLLLLQTFLYNLIELPRL